MRFILPNVYENAGTVNGFAVFLTDDPGFYLTTGGGIATIVNDKPIVIISKQIATPMRQRKLFDCIVAHELGHIESGHLAKLDQVDEAQLINLEFEADAYAAAIHGKRAVAKMVETITAAMVTAVVIIAMRNLVKVTIQAPRCIAECVKTHRLAIRLMVDLKKKRLAALKALPN